MKTEIVHGSMVPESTEVSGPSCGHRESLLIISDIHLGSDINDQLPAADVVRRSRQVDQDLVHLLRHYKTVAPRGERWRLIIAGDLVDFIGMAVRPSDDELETELSDEERAHGLGSAEDHARAKLRRVVDRHADVFDALAEFLVMGNVLTIVHGNHDLEFHWDGVKTDFRWAVVRAASRLGIATPQSEEAMLGTGIQFEPWFYYVGGVAYIEHGHQYDPYCSTDHVMAPLSPEDPRRISQGFSDVLLRYVVRRTKGMKEYGHENTGLLYYVLFAFRLGLSGVVSLAWRFAGAVIALFRLHYASISENAKTLRAEHERRLALLAEATRIGVDRVRRLAALQTPPVTRSIRGILASVLLDRLAVAMGASLCLVVTAAVGARLGHVAIASVLVALAWLTAQRYLEKQRKIDPAEDMIDRAAQLARLFPAAFVVMGHTHIPVKVAVNDGGSTYINVGSWAEEEETSPDAPISYRAARTHLVIHVDDGQAQAEFLTWNSEAGPTRYLV